MAVDGYCVGEIVVCYDVVSIGWVYGLGLVVSLVKWLGGLYCVIVLVTFEECCGPQRMGYWREWLFLFCSGPVMGAFIM